VTLNTAALFGPPLPIAYTMWLPLTAHDESCAVELHFGRTAEVHAGDGDCEAAESLGSRAE
jgi:hypothetical protein